MRPTPAMATIAHYFSKRRRLFVSLLCCLLVFGMFLVYEGSNFSPYKVNVKSATNFHEPNTSNPVSRHPALIPKEFTFDEDLIPWRQEVDVNIGTNYDPLQAQAGRFRILVDPLFDVCEKNSALGFEGQTVLCMAVSDFTGFTSFKEYNGNGVSSSLSEVAKGTSHEIYEVISKRTVLVLEAQILFKAIFDRGSKIHRLKLDLQGNELTVLRNIKSFLRTKQIHHIMAECFCPIDGRQIYQIDNDCKKIAAVLQDSGFVTKYDCTFKEGEAVEVSDVVAYKPPANDFWTTWN